MLPPAQYLSTAKFSQSLVTQVNVYLCCVALSHRCWLVTVVAPCPGGRRQV